MSTIKVNQKHPKVINNFYLCAHKNYNMVKEKGAMNYEIIDMKNKPKGESEARDRCVWN
jgi:hypothetical protein